MSWRAERKCFKEHYHCDTKSIQYSLKPAAVPAVTSHITCIPRGCTAILKYLQLLISAICLNRKVKTARCSTYLQMPGAANPLKQVIMLV